MEKWTKGPWKVVKNYAWYRIDGKNGESVAAGVDKRGDSNLICAAPDLYSALKPFANFACDCGECLNCIALKAINKADGIE